MAVRAQASRELVVPSSVRRRAGIKAGDRLEFEAARGIITIRKSPKLDADEYTPAQRRMIQTRLAEGAEDIRQGRVHGPFKTVGELERSLRRVGRVSVAKRESKTRS